MDYKEKYPQPKDNIYKIPQDVEVEEGIIYCGRFYPCVSCGVITPFRRTHDDCPPTPCCSHECRLKAEADEEEVADAIERDMAKSKRAAEQCQSPDTKE